MTGLALQVLIAPRGGRGRDDKYKKSMDPKELEKLLEEALEQQTQTQTIIEKAKIG